jgi:nucleosome binding factor SPN SPT16 subunit
MSTPDILQSQAVYLNVCSKYNDICCMASRTLLVNPKTEQIAAYKLAVEALEMLRQNLKVGEPISQAYAKVTEFVKEKNSDLNMHTNLGFGIGF